MRPSGVTDTSTHVLEAQLRATTFGHAALVPMGPLGALDADELGDGLGCCSPAAAGEQLNSASPRKTTSGLPDNSEGPAHYILHRVWSTSSDALTSGAVGEPGNQWI